MKKITILLICLILSFSAAGCSKTSGHTDILTTTAPLYEFTTALCSGTELTVDCLISESISCLHDYTLQTKQMRAIESAELVVISGAGLEESFSDVLAVANTIVDTSVGVPLLCPEKEHEHSDHAHEHHHESDPHIWLAPSNARIMVDNIYTELCKLYPQYQTLFHTNRDQLVKELDAISAYAETQLSGITSRKLITFHDGFGYLANAFDLQIVHAIEEESGREASAAELIHLCKLVEEHNIKCIFTEINGSISAAEITAAETQIEIRQLDMAMSGNGYFNAMYHNIDCLKEALG